MAADYSTLRDSSLADLKKYMDSLDPEQGKKLAYWIKDYTHFLSQEKSFQPQKLIRYKRGAIVKVHLGYRVGSEEGGLHYAIVMDRNNTIYNPTVTIIPLTSVKPSTDITNLHESKVHIGDEVYTLLANKLTAEIKSANGNLAAIRTALSGLDDDAPEREALRKQLTEVAKQIAYCGKMNKEVEKMKPGSIAMVGQITTVSKLRIYDPKYKNDIFTKLRVSSATLDTLDERVQQLFGTPKSSN